MPDKKTTEELNKLSLLVYGNQYHWQKLRKKGLVYMKQPHGKGFTARRMPLTVEQVKHYLTKTLEMREKISEDMEKKNASK